MESRTIQKVAILGTGVMGSQIAAHFVNANVAVILYGLSSEDKPKNTEAEQAVAALLKQNPAPLASKSYAARITKANYDEHLPLLSDCDLVIEVISENIQWKYDLYEKVIPHLKDSCILASNTSAIPLETLAKGLPENLRSRFVGVHFFNPPRYMQLLELIAQPDTSKDILDRLEGFFTSRLGKGVVRAQDKPGFIGNRIGVFAMMAVQKHAHHFGLAPDVVDELTGTMIGRPKSATYRTLDLVGIDTFMMVVNELKEALPDDPWADYFAVPDWISELAQQGALGAKTKKGVYEKRGKDIWMFDVASNDYRQIKKKQVDKKLREIFTKTAPAEQFEKLVALDHPQAKFLLAVFGDIFAYSAFHMEAIAHSAYDIDMAMRWGYGWEQGPLEQWQDFGWERVAAYLKASITDAEKALPVWVDNCTAVHSDSGSWSVKSAKFTENLHHPVYQKQWQPPLLCGQSRDRTVIFEDDDICYWTIDNEVGILSFKTKMHVLSYGVLKGMEHVLDIAEKHHKALIVYQEEGAFSAGANLYEVLMGVKLGKMDGKPSLLSKMKQKAFDTFSKLPEVGDLPSIETVIALLQTVLMRFKHGPVPTVAAVSGLALGGGCELLLHCNRVVAHIESYVGLVEVGVGVLPAGGGTKEMALRASEMSGSDRPLLPILAQYFEQIAMAKVATSAAEARDMGYLREGDKIVMHRGELLSIAHAQAHSMASDLPPWQEPLRVMGQGGKATLRSQVVNLLEGQFISEHDAEIVTRLAEVITGGAVPENTVVSAEHVLDLERKHFLALLAMDKTQDRIEHMLKNSKPLRN